MNTVFLHDKTILQLERDKYHSIQLKDVTTNLNYSIPNSLGNNELSIFSRAKSELCSNVGQGNTRIGESNGTKASLDDIVAEA